VVKVPDVAALPGRVRSIGKVGPTGALEYWAGSPMIAQAEAAEIIRQIAMGAV
jgi:hypothetical protein